MILSLMLLYIINYLIGSIPFSYIIGRLYGEDIRVIGSGNVGATNVLRSCGKVAGTLAYAADVGKGVVTALGTYTYLIEFGLLDVSVINNNQFTFYNLILFISFFVPVIGHIFPIYLKFRGGKGVSISAGILLVLLPVPLLLSLLIFTVVLFWGKIVSVASIISSISLPWILYSQYQFKEYLGILGYQTSVQAGYPRPLVTLTSLLATFIVLKHRSNIRRLVKGRENSF